MILIALGSNRPGPWGSPRQSLERAITMLNQWPLKLVRASTLYITKPMGPQNQPDYVNAAAQIETHLSPSALLQKLHAIERDAGRTRRIKWGPRTLDLDIIDYHSLRMREGRGMQNLVLPHPGIAERSFVLEPLMEIAPRWRHPVTHQSAELILRKLNR
jgi:2-amino-4-hydroxy-6-hydroxymethyldihydropteridine diphosphokinase